MLHSQKLPLEGIYAMATQAATAELILSQIHSAGESKVLKMFGEYGLYCDGKVVALICDDQLFIKPTEAGQTFLGEVETAPPYPGSKDYFLIPEDMWEEPGFLAELVRVTADALPAPKPKKPRAKAR